MITKSIGRTTSGANCVGYGESRSGKRREVAATMAATIARDARQRMYESIVAIRTADDAATPNHREAV